MKEVQFSLRYLPLAFFFFFFILALKVSLLSETPDIHMGQPQWRKNMGV